MKQLLFIALVALVTSVRVHAENAGDDAQAQMIFQKLIAANQAKDYDAFVADGTDGLKAALSKTQFEAAANILGPQFSKQPALSLLGELNQRGYEVYLYRLRFTDGTDDILGTLSLKDGKVAGILYR